MKECTLGPLEASNEGRTFTTLRYRVWAQWYDGGLVGEGRRDGVVAGVTRGHWVRTSKPQ